jgi:hypothetical protein
VVFKRLTKAKGEQSMKRFYIVSLLVAGLLLSASGCSTLADVRKSQGQGTSRVYNARFDTVWGAVPKALEDLGLCVVSDNKQEGYVLAQKGMTLVLSAGENVAVFVTKAGEEQTKVEAVSKKAKATDILARNWEKPILDKLSEMLTKK